jgi:hypothetical protein
VNALKGGDETFVTKPGVVNEKAKLCSGPVAASYLNEYSRSAFPAVASEHARAETNRRRIAVVYHPLALPGLRVLSHTSLQTGFDRRKAGWAKAGHTRKERFQRRDSCR